MTLLDYTLLSVSVAATLFSIFLIALLIGGYQIMQRVGRIIARVEGVSQNVLDVSETVKSRVESTADTISQFVATVLTFKGIKDTVSHFIHAFQESKTRKE